MNMQPIVVKNSKANPMANPKCTKAPKNTASINDSKEVQINTFSTLKSSSVLLSLVDFSKLLILFSVVSKSGASI